MLSLMLALTVLSQGAAIDPAKTMADYEKKLREAQTLSGKMTYSMPGMEPVVFQVTLMKPNRFRMISPLQEIWSDGETMWVFMPDAKQYQKSPAPEGPQMAPGLEVFSNPKELPYRFENPREATWEEKKVVAVDMRLSPDMAAVLFISPETSLPIGMEFDAGGQAMAFRYSEMKLNETTITPAMFAFTPPEDATELRRSDPAEGLIKVGEEAPNFTLPSPDGAKRSLKESLEGKKAVLINFWFYH